MDESKHDNKPQIPNVITSLINICNTVITNKLTGLELHLALQAFPSDRRLELMNYLPLSLSIDMALSLVSDEIFWQRKCLDQGWNHIDFWLSSCSWKNTFVTHYVENAIDKFMMKQTTFSELEESLFHYKDCLRKLTFNGFKYNDASDEFDGCSVAEETFPPEIYAFQLISMFPHIEEIYFYNFPVVCDASIPEEENDNEAFCQIFSNLTKLRLVSVIGTRLNKVHLSQLIDGLMRASNIVVLDLSCNLIGDEACHPITKLSSLPRLQTLKLRKNTLGVPGALNLSFLLKETKTLETLDLSSNFLGDEGASIILECLLSNEVLRTLDISNNNISLNCGTVLKRLIERNRILQDLNISGNSLGEGTGKSIAKEVQRNSTILFLGIQFCGFRKEDEDFIHLCVSCNAKS